MSIIHKVSELFYGRIKNLALNSTHVERGYYGEDFAVAYCKRTLGFHVIAATGATRDMSWISTVWMPVFVFVEVRTQWQTYWLMAIA